MNIIEAHLLLWRLQADTDFLAKTPLCLEDESYYSQKTDHCILQEDGTLRCLPRSAFQPKKQQLESSLQELEALKDQYGTSALNQSGCYLQIKTLIYRYLDHLLLQGKWEKLASELVYCQTLPVHEFIYQHLQELVLTYIYHGKHSALTSIMGLQTTKQDALEALIDDAFKLIPQPLDQEGEQCLAHCLHLLVTAQDTDNEMIKNFNPDNLNAFKTRVLHIVDKLFNTPHFHPDLRYQNHTALWLLANMLPILQAELSQHQTRQKLIEQQLQKKDKLFHELKSHIQSLDAELAQLAPGKWIIALHLPYPKQKKHQATQQRLEDLHHYHKALTAECWQLWEQAKQLNCLVKVRQTHIKLHIELILRLLDQQADYTLPYDAEQSIADRLSDVFSAWQSRHKKVAPILAVNSPLRF